MSTAIYHAVGIDAPESHRHHGQKACPSCVGRPGEHISSMHRRGLNESTDVDCAIGAVFHDHDRLLDIAENQVHVPIVSLPSLRERQFSSI
jgi:hypothetical protein